MVRARLLARFAFCWWPGRHRRSKPVSPAYRVVASTVPPAVPSWALMPTREHPNWRDGPLLTRAQEFRGHGGRWSR